MSLFLLSQPQRDAILLPTQETNKENAGKMCTHEQTIRLKELIDAQFKKAKDILGYFKQENCKTYQYQIITGSILEKYKTVLALKLNKAKRSIQMNLFFSLPSGTYFRVENKNKYTHIAKTLQSRVDKNNCKIINICLNMSNGQLAAHFPIFYIFNHFLENSNSRIESRLLKLYQENLQQALPLLEKIIKISNNEPPFGLIPEPPNRKRLWQNIYRYQQMMGITSHLDESFLVSEIETIERDRIKTQEIKKICKNKQALPSWTLKNSELFEQCILVTNCQPATENNYYLANEEQQFIRSLISMPIQPKNRHACENNQVLNHIYVQNFNNLNLNKINEGGFSQIFLTEIDYFYVYSSQGHEALYEENNLQNNIIHKFVVAKKDIQLNTNSRNTHQSQILKQIKNGQSIFLSKYYIVVNQGCFLSDAVVMDYIPFKNLREYMRANSLSVSLTTKLYLMFSITQSLRYIRDFKIVHLDLKPNNIMIYCNLLIKLIDFGESYHPQVCKQKHTPGFTIPYSPPEIYNNHHHFTSKSDIFSLGVIMYEILYNSRPFEVFEDTEEIEMAMNNYLNKWYFLPEEYETLGERQILRVLNFIISRCISPKPKNRPDLDWIALIIRQCLELSIC